MLARPDSDPSGIWEDTRIVLPEQLSGVRFGNLFTGACVQSADGVLPATAVFGASPVALLVARTSSIG